MKKIIIVLLSLTLLIPTTANANTNDLMQYEPYMDAITQSYIEGSLMLGGAYTQNKQAVYDLIGQMKKNYNALAQENENIKQICKGGYIDCLQGYLGIIGGAVGAGIDYFKNLLNGLMGKIPEKDLTQALGIIGTDFSIPEGYALEITGHDKYFIVTKNGNYVPRINVERDNYGIYLRVRLGTAGGRTVLIDDKHPQFRTYYDLFALDFNRSIEGWLQYLIQIGFDLSLKRIEDEKEFIPTSNKQSYITINNYIQSLDKNTISPDYIPNVKPVLVCTDIKYDLIYEDSNFYLNGEILTVGEDGAAVYNSGNCLLEFTLPTFEFVGDKVVEVTENGLIDIETNEKVKEDGTPDCDGILCWVSNIFKTIAGIPSALISGLLDMLKILFVPSADSFNGFINELNTTMSEKFNLTAFTTVFNEMTPNLNARSVGPTPSNTFDGVMVSGLMGTGEVQIIDGSTINAMLPTIHSWIKGFFYVLLAFFNINHLYKLIRGTTIFESMRGKNE